MLCATGICLVFAAIGIAICSLTMGLLVVIIVNSFSMKYLGKRIF